MRLVLPLHLFLLFALTFTLPSHGKVKMTLPFKHFLLQQPAFEVVKSSQPSSPLANHSLPLVMRLLFIEAEKINHNEVLPQNGDFKSLARSIRPTDIQEVGLQKVELDFPKLIPEDLRPDNEFWLVFQLRQSYILSNNCTQDLTVYANDKLTSSLKKVTSVPLTYRTGDPLLVVNITDSLRSWGKRAPSYVVIIKDSTKYTRDKALHSFANYIDCTLARVCEVIELHDVQSSPVLLGLSSRLASQAALNLLDTPNTRGKKKRPRRDVDVDADKDEREFTPSTTTRTSEEVEDHEDHNSLDTFCHLEEWNVNVEQLGWEWLIYPERIPLNLCLGKCPDLLDRYFSPTSHAVARGLYRMVLGKESKPENTGSCCVPVKYRRFTMLLEKQPGIISLETSSDLSAAKCGCR